MRLLLSSSSSARRAPLLDARRSPDGFHASRPRPGIGAGRKRLGGEGSAVCLSRALGLPRGEREASLLDSFRLPRARRRPSSSETG